MYVRRNLDKKARRRSVQNRGGAVIIYIGGAVTTYVGQNVDKKARRWGGHNLYNVDS